MTICRGPQDEFVDAVDSIELITDSVLANSIDGILVSEEQRNICRVVAMHKAITLTILGETGTGKEELARIVHKMREANEGKVPFVALNCANISGDIAGSLLFGHAKGAFTGAQAASLGAVAAADGGILFLDEIHHLPSDTQRRLLRVMNDGSYARLGETTEAKATIQIIVASTKDLDDAVDDGSFLLDLRMRLTGIEVYLPPLRERIEDIENLVRLIMAKHGIKVSPTDFFEIVARCKSYYWRGNIRQLAKVIQTMGVIAHLNNAPVKACSMPEFRSMFAPSPSDESAKISGKTSQAISYALELIAKTSSEDIPLEMVSLAVEKAVISEALKRHVKITDVYRSLGISRTNLDLKRRRHNL